jgi:hypothetical protein
MSKKQWSQKKNQHYVPQGYLRKFTIPGQKSLIWSCDKFKAEFLRFPSSVNKICARDYYYYQIEENGDINHTAFEDALSEVEHAGIAVIHKVIGSSAMPYAHPGAEAQGELAFFMALLLTRGPAFRDAINELHGLWVQQTMQQLYQDGELAEVPSPLLQLIQKKGINNVIKADIYSYASLEPLVTMADEIAHTMLSKGWTIYRAPDDRFFVTSDTPVVFGLPLGFLEREVGPGHPHTEFIIPISKGLALVISPCVEARDSFVVKTATTDEWHHLNSRIIAAAGQFIFSPEKADWIIEMSHRFSKAKQALTIQPDSTRSFRVIDHPFRSNP